MVRLVVVSLGVILVGSAIPFSSFLEYWALPNGTAFRPMEIAPQFLFCGCGTAMLILYIVVRQLWNISKSDWSRRDRALACLILLMVASLSFTPLVITTYGFVWVVQTHHLRLKP
jgi:hypothetical protein